MTMLKKKEQKKFKLSFTTQADKTEQTWHQWYTSKIH